MLETAVLALFAAGLLLCLLAGQSVLYAILFGYFVFFGYGLYKKIPAVRLLSVSGKGIRSVKNILITFILIGMLTAVWRGCGTIATIICAATGFMAPSLMVLLTFWLCCLLSFLTGTAFGAAATMGVICMSISNVMGLPPALTGGAILSGIFFGDRCSPMSTSAQLVCGVTGTDIYRNIKRMLITCAIPFALTSAIYLAAGLFFGTEQELADVTGVFRAHYNLSWITLLPALVTVLFSVLRVNVRMTMLASVLSAGAICLWVQGIALPELLLIYLRGYRVADPALAALVNGGGILSMLQVGAIICVSSTYAGLFEESHLLDNTRALILRMSERINPFGAVTVVSALTSCICCNQTLATIITNQLSEEVMPEPYERALALENTVVVLSGLVPWSIAGAVPLATVGAPMISMFFACYLYLVPLCDYIGYCTGRGINRTGGVDKAL